MIHLTTTISGARPVGTQTRIEGATADAICVLIFMLQTNYESTKLVNREPHSLLEWCTMAHSLFPYITATTIEIVMTFTVCMVVIHCRAISMNYIALGVRSKMVNFATCITSRYGCTLVFVVRQHGHRRAWGEIGGGCVRVGGKGGGIGEVWS